MTKVTGWDNGLSQDYDKGLGRWFANRLGARQQLRQDFEMTQVLIARVTLEQALDALNDTTGLPSTGARSFDNRIMSIRALRAAIANAEMVEPEDGCAPNHMCNGHRVHIPTGECCNKCGATSW